MQALKRLVSRLLRETANKIDADTCELSEEESLQIIEVLSHTALSKEKARIYLNLSRSRFDALVREAVPNEEHLAKFIKGMIDDPDADEGYIFNRFYADSIFMNNPIEWEDML